MLVINKNEAMKYEQLTKLRKQIPAKNVDVRNGPFRFIFQTSLSKGYKYLKMTNHLTIDKLLKLLRINLITDGAVTLYNLTEINML